MTSSPGGPMPEDSVNNLSHYLIWQPNNPVVGKPNARGATIASGAFGVYAISTIFSVSLSIFRYGQHRDNAVSATAYDPKILLKIILFAYSRGIVSSRRITQACEENIIFMALSCDTKTPLYNRQVANFTGKTGDGPTLTDKMKRKMDSAIGRVIYGMRLAISEPRFRILPQPYNLIDSPCAGRRRSTRSGTFSALCIFQRRSTGMGRGMRDRRNTRQ